MSIDPKDRVTAECYLVMEPDIRGTGSSPYVAGIRVVKMTIGKPAIGRGQVVIKVSLNFDKRQLVDAIPEVTADIESFNTMVTEILTKP